MPSRPPRVAVLAHTTLVPAGRGAPRRTRTGPHRGQERAGGDSPSPHGAASPSPQESRAGARCVHRALVDRPWLLEEARAGSRRGLPPYGAFDRFGVPAMLRPRDYAELRGVLGLLGDGRLPRLHVLHFEDYQPASSAPPARSPPLQILADAALFGADEAARLHRDPRDWAAAAGFAAENAHRPEIRFLRDLCPPDLARGLFGHPATRGGH